MSILHYKQSDGASGHWKLEAGQKKGVIADLHIGINNVVYYYVHGSRDRLP